MLVALVVVAFVAIRLVKLANDEVMEFAIAVPKLAIDAKRFVELAVVAKKFVVVALSKTAPPVRVSPPAIVVAPSVEAPAESVVPESVVPWMVALEIVPPVTVGLEIVRATLLVGARLLMLLVRATSLCKASS